LFHTTIERVTINRIGKSASECILYVEPHMSYLLSKTCMTNQPAVRLLKYLILGHKRWERKRQ